MYANIKLNFPHYLIEKLPQKKKTLITYIYNILILCTYAYMDFALRLAIYTSI